MKLRILISIFWLMSLSGWAQEVEFNARVSAQDVTTDDVFRLEISYNANGRFTPPEFKDFHASGGHQGSSETVYIQNGQIFKNSSYTRTYSLKPKKSGKLVIESATLIVDGKKYKTVPIQIEVKQGANTNDNSNAGDFSGNKKFIGRLVASKSEIFQGQHLTVSYKMYSPFNFRQLLNLELPTHNGFWKKSLSDPNHKSYNVELETINGRRYYVVTLERELLISKQSGDLTLGPFEVEAVITDGWRAERVKTKSNTISIKVKPLPEGEPANFSGGVGNFNITAEASKQELGAEDDGIDLKITVSGSGNIEFMDDPEVRLPKEFDMFPPETEQSISANHNGTKGKKEYNYFIVPLANGEYNLGPFELSYFDPETGSYKSVSTEKIPVKVDKPDLLDQIAADPNKKLNVVSNKELRYIKQSADLEKNPVFLVNTVGFWAGIGSPLLLFFVLLFLKRRKNSETEEERIERKAKSASKMARQRLQNAHNKLNENNNTGFIVENLKTLYSYLSEKLNMKVHEMSKDGIKSVLIERGVNEETVSEYLEIIRDCEIARYGGQNIDFRGIYNRSTSVLESLDQNLSSGSKRNNKKLVVSVLMLLSTVSSFGGDFKDANDLYKDGNYQEAASQYESLIKEGYVSPELYYNAGNAFYKSGSIGKAVLYLSKAKKLDPSDQDIVYNLDSIAQPAVLDNIQQTEITGIKKAVVLMITNKSRNFWSVLTLILFVSGIALLSWYVLTRSVRIKRIAFYSGMIAVVMSLLFLSFSFVQKEHLTSEEKGVIMVNAVDVLTEPSNNASMSFTLHEGTTVEIIESNSNWHRIKAGNNQGWIQKESLERI